MAVVERLSSLTSWLDAYKVERKVEPFVTVYGGGIGIRAVTDLPADECVISLPSELVLRASSLLNTRYGQSLTTTPLEEVPIGEKLDELLLVLAVMGLREQVPAAWAPYDALLPTSFDSPISWEEEERSWLEGTPLYGTTEVVLDGLRSLFAALEARATLDQARTLIVSSMSLLIIFEKASSASSTLKSVQNTPGALSPPSLASVVPVDWPTFNWGSFLYAYLCVSSRALLLKIEDKEETALAPFISFCNHSFAAQLTSKRWVAGRLEIRSSVPCKAGEEVYLQYRPSLPNSQLLLFYGFVLSGNPHDSIPFSFEPPDEEEEAEFGDVIKRLLLLRLGEAEGLSLEWEIGRGELPPGLLATLRLLLAPHSILAQLDVNTLGSLYSPFSDEHEAVVKGTLSGAFHQMRDGLGSLDDPNERINFLQGRPSDTLTSSERHELSALIYRGSLIEILDQAIGGLGGEEREDADL